MKAHLMIKNTAWKVSKYGVFSGPYFPVFSPNAAKYEPEKTLEALSSNKNNHL